jgi:hypothetical protein
MLKEYIDGIKVIKYNGWEEIVIQNLKAIRIKETQIIVK